MRIVILGAGTLGTQTARELTAEKKDVVIIERDADLARGVANELDCRVVEGNGEDPSVLEDAGLEDADWFIALTESDEANIVACGIVSETFRKPKTIARVRNQYFALSGRRGKRFLGVDYMLNPEAVTAEAVVRMARAGYTSLVIALKEPGIQLRRLKASMDIRFPGRLLQDIRSSIGPDFLVAAVVRDESLFVPPGNFIFDNDDTVYVLGSPTELDRSFGQATNEREAIRSVLVVGATQLADRVLTELGVPTISDEHPRGLRVGITLIEENRDKAKRFAMKYPGIDVVCREFHDELLLEHERVGDFDLVLCLTQIPSLNIVLAQLAKSVGCGRVIATVLNDGFMRLEGIGNVDVLVNQRAAVAGAILDLVRKANIVRLHSFPEGELELVELTIGPESSVSGRIIRTLNLPRNILIAFVIHQGKTTIPTGDTVMHPGDIVGAVVPKSMMERVETIFGV